MNPKVILPIVLVIIISFIVGLVTYGNWRRQQPFIWKEWEQNFFGDNAFNEATTYLNEDLVMIADIAPIAASYDGLTYLGCTFQFENATESVTWNFPIYWVHFYLWAKR